jgi:hypothetical protein
MNEEDRATRAAHNNFAASIELQSVNLPPETQLFISFASPPVLTLGHTHTIIGHNNNTYLRNTVTVFLPFFIQQRTTESRQK